MHGMQIAFDIYELLTNLTRKSPWWDYLQIGTKIYSDPPPGMRRHYI